jgi:MoxR-like ATPase
MLSNDDYRATYLALNVCVNARIPVILWGPPGQGKTSVINAIAKQSGRALETLLASIREPQDFAGLPSITNGRAQLVSPDWALRLAEDGNGILFTDEVNTAPPTVQAALLRVCLDKVAGDCHLGDQTSIIAAANPPEQAADGWDLAAPLANRFCHLDWSLPSDVVRDGLSGVWPTYELPKVNESATEESVASEKILVAGFLTSRPDLTTALPKATSEQGRAFPTPRSWEAAAILSGWASALGLHESVRRILVRGSVGQGAAAEYLTYRANLDLPKPKDVLKDPAAFAIPKRADLVYVIAAGVLAEIRNNPSKDNWSRAGEVLERLANNGSPDIAVSLAREWLKLRPANAQPDTSILQALVPLLKEANLI